MGFLKQYYDILKNIMENILSNKCTVCDDNLLVRCDSEECCCTLIINTVFNHSSLQGNFLTQSATNTKMQQTFLVRKRKHMSHIETACSSGLLCGLITACLQVQPEMIKVSCLKFYLDKIVEILTAQNLSFIIASSGKFVFCCVCVHVVSGK